MNTKPDRRQYKRFSIDFKIEVVAHDKEGIEYKEETALEEISGEGARFLTRKAERYFIGQSLEMSIYLPGTDKVMASMRGKAMVVRVEPCSNTTADNESQQMYVAVKFDEPLCFERVELGT